MTAWPLPPLDSSPGFWLGVVALGLAVGFVAGLFGIGGGFLTTPLLAVVFRLPIPVAVGTGLCGTVGTATAAYFRHRTLGQGEIRVDLLMLAGSLVGVEAGARAIAMLAAAAPVRLAGRSLPAVTLVVDAMYAVVLVGAAALFWRQGRARYEALEYLRPGPLARWRLGAAVDLPGVGLEKVSGLLLAYLGLLLGFLSGLLGIGGGIALMPVVIYGLGFSIRQAAGTGIVLLTATAAVGTVAHARHGHVHLGLALVLLAGSTITAQFGALATRHLPARTLRRLFALVMLATAAAVLWDLGRRFS